MTWELFRTETVGYYTGATSNHPERNNTENFHRGLRNINNVSNDINILFGIKRLRVGYNSNSVEGIDKNIKINDTRDISSSLTAECLKRRKERKSRQQLWNLLALVNGNKRGMYVCGIYCCST